MCGSSARRIGDIAPAQPALAEAEWSRMRKLRRHLRAILLFATVSAVPVPAQVPPLPTIHPRARGEFSAVLMWHDVVPGKKLVWFDITVKELEAEFQAIARAGLTPISLERLAAHLEAGAPVPRGAVVLTFDDNNLGLYDHLYPMLRRRKWPAAFFVHTDYVGVRTGKDHCTWDQLREMERSGLIKVYPHTASHPADLRTISAAQLARELTGARLVMEQQLGGERRFFAYPEGHFDERIARAVWQAGYRLGITEEWGAAQKSPNRMMIHRYSMHRRARQAIQDVRSAMVRDARPSKPRTGAGR